MADPSGPINGHAWQATRGRSSTVRAATKQARQRKIYVVGVGILVLAATIAALLFYWHEPPRPALAVLRIDQYHDRRIPFCLWAAQDRDGLGHLGFAENNAFTSQEKQSLQQQLADIGKNQSAKQPLVIYLSAYAVVQDDGTVAVLPADAKLDDATTWLPVKDVLEALKDCPVHRVLLLLDLAQPCIEPKAGVLTANVPERLRPALQTAVNDNKKLQIFAACSPGQVSLGSEELGHTVFAHYLIKGMAGRADGFTDGLRNSRVTRRELVSYTTIQVDRWVYHTTGQRQTPEYFGTEDDYDLTSTDRKTVPTPTPLPSEYPNFLLDGWAERDRWWNERGKRTPPDQIRRLEETLLLADERWRKGDGADKVEPDLQAALTRIKQKRLASVPSPEESEPRSLAEAVARGQKVPNASDTDAEQKQRLRELKILGDEWALVKQPKPNEKPSESAIVELQKHMEGSAKKYGTTPFDFAWTIISAAQQDREPRSEHLRCWCQLLQTGGKPLPPYEEIRFLKRLADLLVVKPEDWPPAVSDALQLSKLAEELETLNPAQQPWLTEEYATALNMRKDAETLLFAPVPADRLNASAPIKKALKAFDDLYEHLTTLRDAQRTHDEAYVFLRGYPPYLEHNSSRLDVWLEGVQNAPTLKEILSKKPAPDELLAKISQVKQKASTLQNNLRKLREPLDAPLARAPIPASLPARPADAMEMRALLRLPGLTATQRQTIWTNARIVAGKLNDEVVEREDHTDTLPPSDDSRAIREERARAQLRARISEGLLHLDGSTEEERVDAARQQVERAPLEESAWEALRRELRNAWKQLESPKGRS